MRIILLNGNNLSKMVLPSKIDGSFWLEDDVDNVNLVNVEAMNGKWVMKSNDEIKINYNNSQVSELPL